MMSTQSKPVAQEASGFERALRDRSWDWLLELRRRLKVDLVVVDGRSRVLLPVSPAEHTGNLIELVESDPARTAIRGAVDARTTHSFEREGLEVACVPIAVDSATPGALVVARSVAQRGDVSGARGQLETVASWLATAISSHIESPPGFQASGLHRVAPLARVLTPSGDTQSDRDLIRLFCQAMAVWHDIDVCAYVETSEDSFTRDVTLPGVGPDEPPMVIAAAGLPESSELMTLPQGHLDRFGLPVYSAVYVRRIRRDAWRSWLLVFTGSIDAHNLDRLTAYAALLEMALALTTEAACTRAVAAVGHCLSDAQYETEVRARNALGELCHVIQADSALLTCTAADGQGRLAVAYGEMQAAAGRSGEIQIDLVKRSKEHYTTAISLTRERGLPFTPRDQEVAAAVLGLFEACAAGAAGSAPGRRDRRAVPSEFDGLITKAARRALEEGQPVAALVVVLREGQVAGVTQQSVGKIRAQLRGSDLAGMLAEREIGLLIHGVDRQQAGSIADRLRVTLSGRLDRNALDVGIAARSPGQASPDSLIREARADAVTMGRPAAGNTGTSGGDV